VKRAFLSVGLALLALLLVGEAAAQTIKTNRAQRSTVRVFAIQGVDVVQAPSKTRKKKRPFGLPRAGHGSGMLVTPDGLVLTARHVVENATMLAVRAPGHEKAYGARVIYIDPELDIAFIKADGQFADHVALPDSATAPAMGDPALAIGYPLDSRDELPTQMNGSVAGLTRDKLYKLSMALNPGNSGGPVFADTGAFLGVAIKTADPRQGAQGLSIAVPLEPILVTYRDHVKDTYASEQGEVIDPSVADLTAMLVMAGAEGLYDEVNSLATGPTRTDLYDAMEEASRKTKSADVLALLAAYFFDLAGAVLEHNGAYDVAEMPPGKARNDAARAVKLSVSLAERAVKLDADVKRRSPFISILLKAAHAKPRMPEAPPGYFRPTSDYYGPSTIAYEEGDPIPPGYVHDTRIRKGLVIGGSVTFGACWLASVVAAASLTASEETSGATFDEEGNLVEKEVDDYIPLYIPLAGPFITIATADAEVSGAVPLIIDGIAQAGGVAMLIAGLAAQEDVLRHVPGAGAEGPTFTVTPIALPGHFGLGVVGSF
jgi:hypothetical protein